MVSLRCHAQVRVLDPFKSTYRTLVSIKLYVCVDIAWYVDISCTLIATYENQI
jgi:hypothetical protein